MKLYNVPKNTKIRIQGDEGNEIFTFHHIDGMYSYCTDSEKNVVHLQAWSDVEIVDEVPHT